jgi:hypothetical protein
MSPQNGLDFLAYSRSDLLDNVCHYFDTTDADFGYVERGVTSIFKPRRNILSEFPIVKVFNDLREILGAGNPSVGCQPFDYIGRFVCF